MNENKITHPVTIAPVKIVGNSGFGYVREEDYEKLEQKNCILNNFANERISDAGRILNQSKNLK